MNNAANILDQITGSFKKGNSLAIALGLFGAFVPVMSFGIKTFGMEKGVSTWYQVQTYIVAAGLLYSCHTVWKWMTVFTGNKIKAGAFVILMEGGMMFGNVAALSYIALFAIVFANGVAATHNLLAQKEAQEAAKKAEKAAERKQRREAKKASETAPKSRTRKSAKKAA